MFTNAAIHDAVIQHRSATLAAEAVAGTSDTTSPDSPDNSNSAGTPQHANFLDRRFSLPAMHLMDSHSLLAPAEHFSRLQAQAAQVQMHQQSFDEFSRSLSMHHYAASPPTSSSPNIGPCMSSPRLPDVSPDQSAHFAPHMDLASLMVPSTSLPHQSSAPYVGSYELQNNCAPAGQGGAPSDGSIDGLINLAMFQPTQQLPAFHFSESYNLLPSQAAGGRMPFSLDSNSPSFTNRSRSVSLNSDSAVASPKHFASSLHAPPRSQSSRSAGIAAASGSTEPGMELIMTASFTANATILARRASVDGNTNKPLRFKPTEAELDLLIQIFQKNPFPSAALRQKLAEQMCLDVKQVQFWFQNRRQTMKVNGIHVVKPKKGRSSSSFSPSKKRTSLSPLSADSTFFFVERGADKGTVAGDASCHQQQKPLF